MSLVHSDEALALARRVVVLDWAWGWCGDADSTFVGDPDDPEEVALSFLEHYLHEISHAVDLGLSQICAGTQDEVGKLVPDSNERWYEPKICAEARALAIEWCCWRRLGIGFEWGALVDLGSVQDVEEDQIWAELDGSTSDECSVVVLELLRRALDDAQVSP